VHTPPLIGGSARVRGSALLACHCWRVRPIPIVYQVASKGYRPLDRTINTAVNLPRNFFADAEPCGVPGVDAERRAC
jgi:hypothetical protein